MHIYVDRFKHTEYDLFQELLEDVWHIVLA